MVDSGRRAAQTFAEVAPPVLRLEHRLLKRPIVVPIAAIACVIRQRSIDRSPLVLRRDPQMVKLSAKALDGNVLLVLNRPVEAGPFKSGAEQTLPVTAKVRRKGIVVEVIALTMADPDGFVDALGAAGTRIGGSFRDELVATFGEASPELAAVKEAEAGKRARTARVKFGLLVLALVIGLSARMSFNSVDDSFDTQRFVLQLVVAALIVAAACGIAFLVPVEPAERSRPISDRPKTSPLAKWAGLIVLAAMVLVFGLAVFARRVIGVPGYLAFGPIVALPACFLMVPLILNIRRAQATAEAAKADPVDPVDPVDADRSGMGRPPSPFER